jgi:hypothetical protein
MCHKNVFIKKTLYGGEKSNEKGDSSFTQRERGIEGTYLSCHQYVGFLQINQPSL